MLYSRFSINTISFIISVFIFIVFEIISNKIINENKGLGEEQINRILGNQVTEEHSENNENEIKTIDYVWGIYIPKINLYAPISEGTSKEVMDKYVGHFIDSSVIKGNVCLGAHNRGYPVNYFQDIKKLEKGDVIYYKKDDIIMKYIVNIVSVIKDTDWTYLENTEDNKITLITCVENEPDYRRCVQATEI